MQRREEILNQGQAPSSTSSMGSSSSSSENEAPTISLLGHTSNISPPIQDINQSNTLEQMAEMRASQVSEEFERIFEAYKNE